MLVSPEEVKRNQTSTSWLKNWKDPIVPSTAGSIISGREERATLKHIQDLENELDSSLSNSILCPFSTFPSILDSFYFWGGRRKCVCGEKQIQIRDINFAPSLFEFQKFRGIAFEKWAKKSLFNSQVYIECEVYSSRQTTSLIIECVKGKKRVNNIIFHCFAVPIWGRKVFCLYCQ